MIRTIRLRLERWRERRRERSREVLRLATKPALTEEMKDKRLVWAWVTNAEGEGHWIEVCDFCGGNCGQCGLTARLGNAPVSMDRMVEQLTGKASGVK